VSDDWGSPAERPRPQRRDPRTFIWVLVVVGVLSFLVGAHRISSFTIVYICVLIPSIILHEVSHGVVANIFGDDTAKRAGRLTLNPVPHIDIFGSIILPGLLALSGSGLAFGYAKPVPVTVSRLRHPRNDSVWVSLAGPITNAVLFVGCALAFRYLYAHHAFVSPDPTANIPLTYQILFEASLANLTLGVFNLLPIPPLDGSVLIERLLPARALQQYFRLRPYGLLIVFLFAFIILQNAAVQTHLANAEFRAWNAVSNYSNF
jgi:Zn-dependent protease